jgi:hypothetical protein
MGIRGIRGRSLKSKKLFDVPLGKAKRALQQYVHLDPIKGLCFD